MERAKLIDLTRRFTDAFNRNDFDAVMAFFSDEGVYDEFNGKRNRDKAAIRAAFEPRFSGAFGNMEFLDDDIFCSVLSGSVSLGNAPARRRVPRASNRSPRLTGPLPIS